MEDMEKMSPEVMKRREEIRKYWEERHKSEEAKQNAHKAMITLANTSEIEDLWTTLALINDPFTTDEERGSLYMYAFAQAFDRLDGTGKRDKEAVDITRQILVLFAEYRMLIYGLEDEGDGIAMDPKPLKYREHDYLCALIGLLGKE